MFRFCLWCHHPHLSRESMCLSCKSDLPFLNKANSCPRCAAGPTLQTHHYCGQCVETFTDVDHVISPFEYRLPIDYWLHRFKYSGDLYLLKTLMPHLIEQIQRHSAIKPDVLIAVPLHPARLKTRGFNQAWEIAKRLHTALGIPLLPQHHARRIKKTASQTQLSSEERRKNMARAFELTLPERTQHIAIVDDVVTSGHTVQSLAQVAKKKCGASHVQVWCLARTRHDEGEAFVLKEQHTPFKHPNTQ